jgi:hypothetical protein
MVKIGQKRAETQKWKKKLPKFARSICFIGWLVNTHTLTELRRQDRTDKDDARTGQPLGGKTDSTRQHNTTQHKARQQNTRQHKVRQHNITQDAKKTTQHNNTRQDQKSHYRTRQHKEHKATQN